VTTTNDGSGASMKGVIKTPATPPAAFPRVGLATQAAEAAADASGVQVRAVSTHADIRSVVALFADIWRPHPQNPPVSTEMLRALTKSGNYVAAAFDGDEMIGASVGFFGAPSDLELHSHMAGVGVGAAGRHVGFALKLHQRAWALRRGVAVITWTYDPLVRRNAYFNIVKLGAAPVEYLTDFYGGMGDGINGGDESDRLLVAWKLDSSQVEAACAGRPVPATVGAGTATIALGVAESGGPVAGEHRGDVLRVAVPPDVESMRSTDPALAGVWRLAVRDTLRELMTDGARITGFERNHGYLLARDGVEERSTS
jgi:predicted GNAT superfamily acetyltransferase